MISNLIVTALVALSSVETSNAQSINDILNGNDSYSCQIALNDDEFLFSREFDYEIESYKFESDDFELLSNYSVENLVYLNLSISGKPLMHFTLSIDFVNGLNQIDTYSVYNDFGMVFISTQSDEIAWSLMATYAYQNGFYSRAELEILYEDFIRDLLKSDECSIETFSASFDDGSVGSNTTTNVCGTLRIKDSEGLLYPLKNIQVEIYVDGSNILDGQNLVTTTDGSGYFMFYLTKGTYPSLYNTDYHDYYIKFYTKGNTYNLVNGLDALYFDTTDVIENQKNEERIEFCWVIDYDKTSDTSNAFSVCCGFGYGEEFATTYNKIPSGSSSINYVFPSVASNSWTFYTIGAISSSGAYNFSTTLHEYGHYIEQINGAFGRKWYQCIGNQGNHDQESDLIADKGNKKVALMMAWDESLADVFGMIVCDYYEELSSTKCWLTGDLKSLIMQADKYSMIKENSGEGQQYAIIAYLWNLFSDTNERDSLSLPRQEFLDITFSSGTYTLSSFVESFEKAYPDLIFENAIILEECGIAPKITSISFKNTRYFTLTFIPNGSAQNPNNYFNLLFYDENQSLVNGIYGVKIDAESNRDEITYTFNGSSSISALGISLFKTYYISIEGYLDSSPISGPYRSSPVSFVTYGNIVSLF